MIDSDPLSILADLIGIPSVEREAEVASYLASRFDDLSIPYAITEIGGEGRCNITAVWGEGRPAVILNSHMDTVPAGDAVLWTGDPFVPRTLEGRLYGRGACDAKGPLAAMVAAVERIVRSGRNPGGRIVLMAVGAEETAGRGTEIEVEKGVEADAAVVGEPTDLRVCVCHKGVLRLRLRTRGRAVHASEPWNGANAVTAMAPVVTAMDELAGRISARRHPLLGRASLAVTTIRGGTARNVVPPSCKAGLDRRLLPEEDVELAEAEIRSVAEPLGAEVDRELVAEAAETPAAESVVRRALEARRAVLGDAGAPEGFTACCDMRFLTNQARVPAIILGPGSIAQAHNADEYVSIGQLEAAARVYEALIRGLLEE